MQLFIKRFIKVTCQHWPFPPITAMFLVCFMCCITTFRINILQHQPGCIFTAHSGIFLWIVLYFLFCYIPPGLPTKSFLSIPVISLACTNRCLHYILNIKENLLLNFSLHLKMLGFPISLQDWLDFHKEIPQHWGGIWWHICTSAHSDFFALRFYLTCIILLWFL